jgi:hypothetical protein
LNDRVQALGDPGNDPIKLADTEDRASSIVRETLYRLRGLRVPAGEAPTVGAIYAKVDTVVREAGAYASALRARNERAVRTAAAKLDVAQRQANAASIAYGLTVCGK